MRKIHLVPIHSPVTTRKTVEWLWMRWVSFNWKRDWLQGFESSHRRVCWKELGVTRQMFGDGFEPFSNHQLPWIHRVDVEMDFVQVLTRSSKLTQTSTSDAIKDSTRLPYLSRFQDKSLAKRAAKLIHWHVIWGSSLSPWKYKIQRCRVQR